MRCCAEPAITDADVNHCASCRKAVPKVVLTVAHLGFPVQCPFDFHVTRHTQTDQIVELVGYIVPFYSECFERDAVMHAWALSNFLTGATASGADFIVPLQCSTLSCEPRGTIILPGSSPPIWIRLARWSLLPEPFKTAGLTTKALPESNPMQTCLHGLPAHFATDESVVRLSLSLERILRDLGSQNMKTTWRAGCRSVGSLLRSYLEIFCANSASAMAFTATGVLVCPDHRDILSASPYLINDDRPEDCRLLNLAALCQRCHNRHDAVDRHRRRRERLDCVNGCLSLFS